METRRNRFSVTPFLVAFFAALVAMPATTIVKVNAFGLGTEHEQPWRQRTNGLRAAVASVLGHPLFRPGLACAAIAALAMLDWRALYALPVVFGTLSEGRHAGEFIYEERVHPALASRETITVLSGQTLKAGAVVGRVNKGVGRMTVPAVVGTGNGTIGTVFPGPEVQVGSYVLTCTVAATNAGTFSVTNPSGKVLPTATVAVAYRSREINFTIADGSTDYIVGDSFTVVVDTTAPAVIGTGNGVISGLSLGPDAKTGNYRVENITAITNGGTFKVVGPDGDEVAVGSIVAGASGTLVLSNQRELNLTITDGSTDFAVGDAFNVTVFNNLSGGKIVAWDPTTYDGRDDAIGVLYDNVDAASGDLPGVILTRGCAVIKSSLEWGTAITAAQKESAYLDLAARGVIAR